MFFTPWKLLKAVWSRTMAEIWLLSAEKRLWFFAELLIQISGGLAEYFQAADSRLSLRRLV